MAKENIKASKWWIVKWMVGGILAVVLFLVAVGFNAFGPFAQTMGTGPPVPLPDGRGEIAFQFRTSHPFLAEYDRWIDIRLADGRRLRSPIMDNTGGRTFMLLFWPPVDLPDLRWSFEVVQRHYPRGHAQHFMDHWLILRGPNGLRLRTWFRADTFGGNLATVSWRCGGTAANACSTPFPPSSNRVRDGIWARSISSG